MTMGVVDLIMVGQLGSNALGALGIAHTWSFGTLILGLGAAQGLDPLISQAYGAGRPRQAGRALVTGAALLTALSIPVMGLHWITDGVLTLFGQPPELLADASAYNRTLIAGVWPFFGFALLKQFLQGSGVMRPAMWVALGANLVNVLLNDAFIHGHWGAPAFGVVGSAMATDAARWLMFGGLIVMGAPQIREAWPPLKGLFAGFGRTIRMAIPVAAHIAVEVWAFNVTTLMAGWLGATAVAAHTAVLNMASLSFMVPLGLSAAAATRIGNLVGAEQPWRRAGATAVVLGAAVMAPPAAVFALFPEALASIYTPDAITIATCVAILPLAALFQIVDGTQVVSFGVLRGLGDTRAPAVMALGAHWGLGLPTGLALAFVAGLGLQGLWLGLTAGLGSLTVMLLLRLLRQRDPEVQ